MKNLTLKLLSFFLAIITLSGTSFGQSKVPNYNILTRSGIVRMDPLPAPSPVRAIPGEIMEGQFFRLIQFWETPNETQKTALELQGIRFLEYIPHHAYLVSLPATMDLSMLSAQGVRAVGVLNNEIKTNPTLHNGNIPDYAIRLPGTVDLVIRYYASLSPEFVTGQLNSQGIEMVEHSPFSSWIKIRVNQNEVENIASYPFVCAVEPDQELGSPESDDGRGMHRSSVINADYRAGLHFDGAGVSAVINDDGFVGPHIDFKGRTDQSTVLNDLAGNHGDMTSGILGGAGNIDPTMRGMANAAFIYVLQYTSSMNATVNRHTNNNVMVFSTSYSNGCNAGYTAVTAQIDQECNTYPSIHQVFSAGNSNNTNCGYGAGSSWGNVTGGHKIAKNVMACANLTSDEGLVNSSSRGPASDGRLKPEISSFGNGHMSTDDNNSYQVGSGTSAACPGVAGVSVQLFHAYKQLNGGTNPESALIKMLLMNTADEIGNPGPDFSYGWGRINARKAYLAMSQNRYASGALSASVNNSHNITIPANVKLAKIMVYWRDPAASTIAAKALVNDLDINVIDPGAGNHLPLVLNPTPNATTLNAAAVPGTDTLNNVEQVTISNPAAGTYVLHVNGTDVPMGPQSYWYTWEFEMDEIVVTYPNGGEGFVPGTTERLRWDAFGNTGNFLIEYSTNNGTNWTTISSSVPGNVRYRDWNPPVAASGQCLIRVSRNGISGMGQAPFTIISRPTGITIDYVCPDTARISWVGVANATGYEVSMLGAQFMDSIGTTTATNFLIVGMDPFDDNWVSVKALGPNNAIGRRANAVQVPYGLVNCVLANDVSTEVISPMGGQFWTCLGNAATPVKVRLTNEGSNSLSNIPINYTLNGGSVISQVYPGPLAPGASFDFTFTNTVNTSVPGSVNLKVWSSLASDGNASNDTTDQVTQMLTGSAPMSYPWSDNFETFNSCNTNTDCEITNCTLNNGWLNYSNGGFDDIDFRADAGGTPSTNTGPATDHNPGTTAGKYVYLEASGPCPLKEAVLLSPCIDLSGGLNPQVTFWYHMYGVDMGQLNVEVISEMESNSTIFTGISGNQGNSWRSATINLNAYAGKVVALRFRGVTGNDFASDLALDDINLSLTPVAIQDPILNSLSAKIYPNPSAGNIFLELEDLNSNEITVSVYDVMMKELDRKLFPVQNTSFRTQLDYQNLAQGIYFLHVQSGDRRTILKFEIQ